MTPNAVCRAVAWVYYHHPADCLLLFFLAVIVTVIVALYEVGRPI